MPPFLRYASFLLRMWSEDRAGEIASGAAWHAEVEHIQSTQRWTFETRDDLLSFLRRCAEAMPPDGLMEGKKHSSK